MDISSYDNCIEKWFLAQPQSAFPDATAYVSNYESVVSALDKIHKQVNAGADKKDGTTLTQHDLSHIKKVIEQASALLSYNKVELNAYEAFHLLIAIQIHDIKNIDGREGHENNAIEIFNDLNIGGLIDNRLLKEIGAIVSCHSGSIKIQERDTKDKIGHLLSASQYTGKKKIKAQFLAAILRLADEYADEENRAMTFLLKHGKVAKGSIIHQKHAQSLKNVNIEPDTGIVEFEYYIERNDAIQNFPKYNKHTKKFGNTFLLDEIFERTLKSHYETVYCMRFLRPFIMINKIKVSIEIERSSASVQALKLEYELAEMGYPDDTFSIFQLCGDSLKFKGRNWSGKELKKYIQNS